MNKYQLHDDAELLVTTQSPYTIARELISLKNRLKQLKEADEKIKCYELKAILDEI